MVGGGRNEVLLVNYQWHHAVNNQSKLNEALVKIIARNNERDNYATRNIPAFTQAIEADIIYSGNKGQSVMGHPPSIDGDLTLASFLHQLQESNFQQVKENKIDGEVVKGEAESAQRELCHVLKLDFKSMSALRSGLQDIKLYLNALPTFLHERVWINADILAGPGEDLNDPIAMTKMNPNFNAAEFLKLVTTKLPGTVLSIGWTTSLSDAFAVYTDDMVDEMIECLKPYCQLKVTFPIRATSFRKSWSAMQRLYTANLNWTITLWWSLNVLPKEEFDWIFRVLEREDDSLTNRTYYDIVGFHEHLNNCKTYT